jgi:hypothetical protein
MRLHFHLVNGTETIRDEEGIEVADLDAAKAEALNAIREMRGEQDTEPHRWAHWKLAAADETGAFLFSLDVDTTRGRGAEHDAGIRGEQGYGAARLN